MAKPPGNANPVAPAVTRRDRVPHITPPGRMIPVTRAPQLHRAEHRDEAPEPQTPVRRLSGGAHPSVSFLHNRGDVLVFRIGRPPPPHRTVHHPPSRTAR
eukprot:CAMPEP_0117627210 /NCGR_PEP_ID=MMETSP0802-20121206/1818_1 /TAXON_ID=38833 /ORGANISM="Micromonas sp., Strain CCMP2099" /LENGTH=99 /DNA_ID=CAMNT_0005431353 /DNA_START=299 /DNA_END=595 /DNA_ORIENTATION=-